jgi:antitoxin component of MazEF toxin-antitoxin module
MVRIPHSIAQTAAIDENSMVEPVGKNGHIVVSKSKTYQLDTLLKKIRQTNKHKEALTGLPIGEEAW